MPYHDPKSKKDSQSMMGVLFSFSNYSKYPNPAMAFSIWST